MDFEKLPALEGEIVCQICNCGSHDVLSMDALLAVGFGGVTVTRDGREVWSEQQAEHETPDEYWEGKDAEAAAAKDPEHDWRVCFFAPLYEATYQRQGENHWPLVVKGDGFA